MYKKIPYATVKELEYSAADIHRMTYKLCFTAEKQAADVLQNRQLRNGQTKPLSSPKQTSNGSVDQKKAKDIESLLPYMQGDDRLYMEGIVEKFR